MKSVDSNKKVLTQNLSVPFSGAMTAKIDINAGDGNLTIDRIPDGEQVLASGTLQYSEKEELPVPTLISNNGQATLTLRRDTSGKPWFRLPWAACNGATEWQIHLNPKLVSDITAHSDGGNIKLDLAGMAVTRLSADTGGGNIDMILPNNTASLSVTAKTGAGNVTVELPGGVAARVHVATGLGKAIIDPRLSQIDRDTFQTPGFEEASNKAEITASSGAGNVSIKIRP